MIGSVGRLAPEKDYPLLVRAARPLLGPDARLVIVGDGSEAAAIRTEAAARRCSRSRRCPARATTCPAASRRIDVFALSSRMEGLPLCALEAMAAGAAGRRDRPWAGCPG